MRMNRFSKISVGFSAAALAFAGAACAQAQAAPAGSERDRREARTETRAEAQARAEAMFARLDVNKDGKLDRADREARRQERRSALFDRLDADKDGAISKAEFMADRGPGGDRGGAHPEGDMPRPPGGPEASGDRPAPDHAERRGRHGGLHGDMKRRMPGFGRGDGDRDGSVARSEFVAAALQRFDAIDTDKDGKVTPEERRAAHDRMRAAWQARKGERARASEGAERKAPPPPAQK